jgi:chromosomal replication initiation ATPase DnaA
MYEPPTIDYVRKWVSANKSKIALPVVAKAVEMVTGMDALMLSSPCRKAMYSNARLVFTWYCRELEIARPTTLSFYLKRNHACVIRQHRKATHYLKMKDDVMTNYTIRVYNALQLLLL